MYMCIYNGVSTSIQRTLVPSTVHFEPLKRAQPLFKGHYLKCNNSLVPKCENYFKFHYTQTDTAVLV